MSEAWRFLLDPWTWVWAIAVNVVWWLVKPRFLRWLRDEHKREDVL